MWSYILVRRNPFSTLWAKLKYAFPNQTISRNKPTTQDFNLWDSIRTCKSVRADTTAQQIVWTKQKLKNVKATIKSQSVHEAESQGSGSEDFYHLTTHCNHTHIHDKLTHLVSIWHQQLEKYLAYISWTLVSTPLTLTSGKCFPRASQTQICIHINKWQLLPEEGDGQQQPLHICNIPVLYNNHFTNWSLTSSLSRHRKPETKWHLLPPGWDPRRIYCSALLIVQSVKNVQSLTSSGRETEEAKVGRVLLTGSHGCRHSHSINSTLKAKPWDIHH